MGRKGKVVWNCARAGSSGKVFFNDYGIFTFVCVCLHLYSYIPPRRVLSIEEDGISLSSNGFRGFFFLFSGKFPNPNSFKLDQSLLDLASF